MFVLKAGYGELNGLAFAFATLREPSAEAFGKALRRNAKACFHYTFGNWQSVIKLRCIGEIPHAELIEPLKGAHSTLFPSCQLDLKSLGVHLVIISSRVAAFSGMHSHGPFGHVLNASLCHGCPAAVVNIPRADMGLAWSESSF